jgi:hypothetical protein
LPLFGPLPAIYFEKLQESDVLICTFAAKNSSCGSIFRTPSWTLPHILECLRRPREGTFFSDLAADPKVFLSFHPLHLLSSGYFEKLQDADVH